MEEGIRKKTSKGMVNDIEKHERVMGASQSSRESQTSTISGTTKSSKASKEKTGSDDKKKKKSRKEPRKEPKKVKDSSRERLIDQRKGMSDQHTGLSEAFNDFVMDRSGGLNDSQCLDSEQQFQQHHSSSISTPQTSKTSTTMGTYEQSCLDSLDEIQAAMGHGNVNVGQSLSPLIITCGVPHMSSEKKAMAAFHGEMLQSFLTKHGHDEKLAMEQSMMFEAFLRSQADINHFTTNKQLPPVPLTFVSSAIEMNAVAQLKELEREEDEESRMEQVESLFGDDDQDSFAPDSAWENGSFRSFPNSSMNSEQLINADSFGNMRRNETFMRQKSGDEGDMKPRPRNMVASVQTRSMNGSVLTMVTPPPLGNSLPFSPPPSPPMDQINKFVEVTNRKVAPEVQNMSHRSHSHRAIPMQTPSYTKVHSAHHSLHGLPQIAHNRSCSIGSTETSRSDPVLPVSKAFRSFEDQINSLTTAQRSCVYAIKTTWEQGEGKSKPFPNLWYIRFAKCSPGLSFDFKSALKVMKKFDRRFMNLSIMAAERMLIAGCIFPCRGLRSLEGYEVIYMCMKQYSPKEDSVSAIIDNLVYVVNIMMEREDTSTDGVALVSNFNGFKMQNFSIAYFHNFILALQGRKIPIRVNMWLLVNTPVWFGSIWQIMRPMMTEDFRKKVCRINEKDLGQFMAKGYEQFLPNDMKGGVLHADRIVQNYILERRHLECRNVRHSPQSGRAKYVSAPTA